MTSTDAKIAVVLNGNAKSVTDEVVASLRKTVGDNDLFVSKHIEEARPIAQALLDQGYETILTGGGDGTFTVMVTEIVQEARARGLEPPRFGLLKLGTGNALAWVVGACPLDPKSSISPLTSFRRQLATKKVHLVETEGFLSPFAGLGADAQILADYNSVKDQLKGGAFEAWGKGLSGYALAALTRSIPSMLLQKMPDVRVINEGADAWPVDPQGVHQGRPIKKGDVIYEGPARLTALSTIPYYGFGMRLFPFAENRWGRMNLRISRIGSRQALANLPAIWNGSYYEKDAFVDFLVDKIRIDCVRPTEFQIGGDSQGWRRSVHASVSPVAFNIVNFLAPGAL